MKWRSNDTFFVSPVSTFVFKCLKTHQLNDQQLITRPRQLRLECEPPLRESGVGGHVARGSIRGALLPHRHLGHHVAFSRIATLSRSDAWGGGCLYNSPRPHARGLVLPRRTTLILVRSCRAPPHYTAS
eukprot:1142129-Pleurochrysis_carterae.AAC.1